MIDIETLLSSKGLYVTQMPSGETFSWRLLTIKEYKIFRHLREAGLLPLFSVYEEVFRKCYVGNSDAISGNIKAGISISIGEMIMHLSGDQVIGKEAEAITQARERSQAGLVEEALKRRVLAAFPYKPEDLDTWSYQDLLNKFVLAESVLLERDAFKEGYKPIDVKDIGKKEKPKPMIDMKADNAMLEEEGVVGFNPHELNPYELAKLRNKKNQLSLQDAKKLDKAIKR